jgi:hypothetical protein
MNNRFAVTAAALISFGFLLAPTSGYAGVLVNLGPADGSPVPTYNGFYTVFANVPSAGDCTENSAGTCTALTGVATSMLGTGSYSLSTFELESTYGGPLVGSIQNFNIFTYGFYSPIPFSITIPGLNFFSYSSPKFTWIQQDVTNDIIGIGVTAVNATDNLTAVGFFTFTAPGVFSTLSDDNSYFFPEYSGGPLTGEFMISSFVSTPVSTPEPSTWAMMLIGFAGLGFAGYHRAREHRAAV